jgi:hypothetical protein
VFLLDVFATPQQEITLAGLPANFAQRPIRGGCVRCMKDQFTERLLHRPAVVQLLFATGKSFTDGLREKLREFSRQEIRAELRPASLNNVGGKSVTQHCAYREKRRQFIHIKRQFVHGSLDANWIS